jgi:hypothetical protein
MSPGRLWQVLRNLTVVLVFTAAIALAVWGVGAASYPFRAEYRDSPDSTYFVLGGIALTLSALFGGFAFRMIRADRARDRGNG